MIVEISGIKILLFLFTVILSLKVTTNFATLAWFNSKIGEAKKSRLFYSISVILLVFLAIWFFSTSINVLYPLDFNPDIFTLFFTILLLVLLFVLFGIIVILGSESQRSKKKYFGVRFNTIKNSIYIFAIFSLGVYLVFNPIVSIQGDLIKNESSDLIESKSINSISFNVSEAHAVEYYNQGKLVKSEPIDKKQAIHTLRVSEFNENKKLSVVIYAYEETLSREISKNGTKSISGEGYHEIEEIQISKTATRNKTVFHEGIKTRFSW